MATSNETVMSISDFDIMSDSPLTRSLTTANATTSPRKMTNIRDRDQPPTFNPPRKPMKPSKLYEALHALIGERVPLHIWGACGVGKSQIVAQAT
jgi:hypothetical protein